MIYDRWVAIDDRKMIDRQIDIQIDTYIYVYI